MAIGGGPPPTTAGTNPPARSNSTIAMQRGCNTPHRKYAAPIEETSPPGPFRSTSSLRAAPYGCRRIAGESGHGYPVGVAGPDLGTGSAPVGSVPSAGLGAPYGAAAHTPAITMRTRTATPTLPPIHRSTRLGMEVLRGSDKSAAPISVWLFRPRRPRARRDACSRPSPLAVVRSGSSRRCVAVTNRAPGPTLRAASPAGAAAPKPLPASSPPAGPERPLTERYCPSCGRANPRSSASCAKCGRPLPPPR